MKLKKIISVAASLAVAAGSMAAFQKAGENVTAAESVKTDLKWYDEIITLVQDDVADDGQHAQWYYMTDSSPFRMDGLNVTYNQNVITENCKLSYNAGDSPSKHYNGKKFEYDIPLDIVYGGKDIKSSVIAQIGKKNDANLDHEIDVRDAATISRDVKLHIITKKSQMTEFAKFLVSGSRKSNAYSIKAENAASIAKNLAEEALKRSTGKKLERTDADSGCSLYISSAKGRPGETIALQVIANANNSFEALDAVVEWESGSLNANALYGANGVKCETAIGDGKMAIVSYGDSKVSNGAISTINLTIPEDATPGESMELYFSDVKTFSVLGDEGSENISDNINIKGAKIDVLEPVATKPAVTTTAVETTSVTTTSAATSFTVVPVTSKISTTSIGGTLIEWIEAGLSNVTAGRSDKTVEMELNYESAYEYANDLTTSLALPDDVELVKALDKNGNEYAISKNELGDRVEFVPNDGYAKLILSLPESKDSDKYEVYASLNKGPVYMSGGLIIGYMGNATGYITFEDEKITTSAVTTGNAAVSTSTTVTTVATTSASTTAQVTTKPVVPGDVNRDGVFNVRDASYLAQLLAKGKAGSLEIEIADFNKDGRINIRDAAAMAKSLSNK